MSDIFYFRDFSMRQAVSGQRINTDSCVFGALIGPQANPKSILDIGTGTGVLSLMLAIRFPNGKITAVEPEVAIARVAENNFKASPWHDRIDLKILRAQELSPEHHGTYDFVLCNPPYFQNSTFSPDRLRTVARHNADLSPAELYDSMSKMMTLEGSAWLSFPEDSTPLWLDAGFGAGLHLTHQLVVSDHPDARPHMTIAGWSKQRPIVLHQSQIHYRNSRQGPHSTWMKSFRGEWFPAHYNVQFE